MSNDFRASMDDLMSNPSNRLPVALCLDASGSMTGEPINELNQGVELFINNVKEDPVAAASVELSIVTFSDNAQLVEDFQTVMNVQHTQLCSTGGMTNLGAGVKLALDSLNSRKDMYRRTGIDYFQPWLILMTDGAPTTAEHNTVAPEVCRLEADKKLTVFPIGIGSSADMNVLTMFSKKNQPLKLQGLNFRAFFQWLSASVSKVSQSRPGDTVKLDTSGIKGWADL